MTKDRTWWAIVDISDDLPSVPLLICRRRWWAKLNLWWFTGDKYAEEGEDLVVIPWHMPKK